jgi:hypothetical protein
LGPGLGLIFVARHVDGVEKSASIFAAKDNNDLLANSMPAAWTAGETH